MLAMVSMVASSPVPGASSNQTSEAPPTDTTGVSRGSLLDLLHVADVEDLSDPDENAGNITDILTMAMVAFEEDETAPELEEDRTPGIIERNYASAGRPARPSHMTDDEMRAITDELLYELPLKDFLKRRRAKDPKWLLWKSDGCTNSLDKPFGWPFRVCF